MFKIKTNLHIGFNRLFSSILFVNKRKIKDVLIFWFIIIISILVFSRYLINLNPESKNKAPFFPDKLYKPSKFELCISNFYRNKTINEVLLFGKNHLTPSSAIDYFVDYNTAIENAEKETGCVAHEIILNLDNVDIGGHGDRVNTLINIFYIATISGFKFKVVEYNTPTPIYHFFTPINTFWSFQNENPDPKISNYFCKHIKSDLDEIDYENEILKNNEKTKHKQN